LAEAVLAHPHRHQGGSGVVVVGRADRDRIDTLAHLVEHLAVVGELFRLRKHLRSGGEITGVYVADGHHVAVLAGVIRVADALNAQADAGDGDLLVGRLALLGIHTTGRPKAEARGGGGLQEQTTIRGR
jgi:hypothetical protein